VRLWFWGWLVVAVAIAFVSAATRDRASVPFAAGAVAAALVEALFGSPGWEWIAFVAVSSALFVAVNRRPGYRPRHTPGGGVGRHSPSRRSDEA
jgi:membrane protein implicated in regulation of membrane protease activity